MTVEPLDALDCVPEAEEGEAEALPPADALAEALAAADGPLDIDNVTPTEPDPMERVVTICAPLADRLALASLTAPGHYSSLSCLRHSHM